MPNIQLGASDMPHLKEMDEVLGVRDGRAECNIRMFVQKSSDLIADDFAAEFCQMAAAARKEPYLTSTDL